MVIFIDNLDELRERIKGIDYSIMSLISQRINLAKQVGRLKQDAGLPVKNFQVEKQVYARVGKYAEEFGMEASFAQRIYENIIEQSVEVQLVGREYPRTGSSMNCLVIGGEGKMGGWFTRFLRSTGHVARTADPRGGDFQSIPELDSYDLIVISTPLETIREVVSEVLSRKPRGLVLELASLKSELVDVVTEGRRGGVDIVSIHPMFGPDVKHLSGRNMVYCTLPGEEEKIRERMEELFGATLVNLVPVPLGEHDRHMLYSLGLSHFVNLLVGDILRASPFHFEVLQDFAGTTFNRQVETTREVFAENPRLYFAIQERNRYRDELYAQVLNSARDLISMVSEGREGDFIRMMQEGHSFFTSGEES